MNKVITNAKIYTGEAVLENRNILVRNGHIVAVISELPQDIETIDLAGKNIAPGFIDIQINGGSDKYFSQTPDEETLEDIYQTCCEYGTPFILPTLISSPLPLILQAIDAVRNFREKHPGVLGMHLEGPYFNPAKRGAHHPDIVRKPTDDELKTIIEHGKDVIKLMTIAPEQFTEAQLDMLLESGITLSAGHTAMTYDQAQYYFGKGIQLVTHLYNAMTQMGHRECGVVGAVFDNENVYAPIILDGGHCHYAAARVAYRQKGNKLFLITDSAFLGRSKKQYDWEYGARKMVDGFYRDSEGNLAGAAISMPEAVKNAKEHLGVTLQHAVEMATSRVAYAVNMQEQIGFIKPGYPAYFTVFDDGFNKVASLVL